MRLTIYIIVLFGLCGFFSAQSFAFSDQELEAMTVQQRIPDDYKAEGHYAGSFLIKPKLEFETRYDDNIFTTDGGEVADEIFILKPSLNIKKRYDRHSFSLDMGGTLSRNWKEEDESTEDYALQTKGMLEATSSLALIYRLGQKRSHIERGTPGSTQFTTEPIRVKKRNVEAGLSYRFNRLRLELLGGTERTDYEDGTSKTTGASVIVKDKNRDVFTGTLKAFYDIFGRESNTPEHILFAEASFKKSRFDDVANAAGVITSRLRNNDEIGFLAGISTRYKGLVIGRIGAGYFSRDFENNTDIDRFDFDADLAFNVRPKMTFLLSGGRSTEEDNSFVAGAVKTEGEIGIDYEFLHNLYGGAFINAAQSDYTSGTREDDTIRAGLNLRYLHSRYLQSRLSFERTSRDSNVIGGDYDRNVFMYRLTGQL